MSQTGDTHSNLELRKQQLNRPRSTAYLFFQAQLSS